MREWIVFVVVVGGVLAALSYVYKYGPRSKDDPHDNDDPTSFYN